MPGIEGGVLSVFSASWKATVIGGCARKTLLEILFGWVNRLYCVYQYDSCKMCPSNACDRRTRAACVKRLMLELYGFENGWINPNPSFGKSQDGSGQERTGQDRMDLCLLGHRTAERAKCLPPILLYTPCRS